MTLALLLGRDDKTGALKVVHGKGFLINSSFLNNDQLFSLVNGHSHDWRITASETKLHEVNLPPTAYVFNPARPSGWVRAKVDATGMTLELKALDQTHPEHGMTRTLSWR
jgi:hypothetical protein